MLNINVYSSTTISPKMMVKNMESLFPFSIISSGRDKPKSGQCDRKDGILFPEESCLTVKRYYHF